VRDTIRLKLPWEEFGVLIVGDPHLEAPDHNRQLFLRDLDGARERGDSVWIIGDVWSMILARDLKRFTQGRHGHKMDAAINSFVSEAFEVLRPYADNIDIMLLGNHEAEVIRRHHVDPLALLIDRLNQVKTSGHYTDADGNPRIAHAGYTAWVQVQFHKYYNGKRTWSASNMVWLHHGKGGGAPVTHGIIDANRIRSSRFAHVFAIGHKHTSLHDSQRFEYLDNYGNKQTVWQDFIIVGGYSGQDIEDDYEANGYTLDYSAEQHYGLESQGSKRIVFIPGSRSVQSRAYPHIRRRVEQETA
jgi:hypothetical protein